MYPMPCRLQPCRLAIAALMGLGAVQAQDTERPPLPPQPSQGQQAEEIRAYVVPDIDLQPVKTQEGGATWERNPSLAFRKAKAMQKPLVLLFTARWNEGCQKLSEEVFSSKTFNTWAKENVVLCFLDYPQNYNNAPEPMKRVKDHYQIRGYPNLLIFNPQGKVVREIGGYRPGRPVDYYNTLHGATDPLVRHLKQRKEALMKQGFRTWTNRQDGKLFARFIRHDGVLFTLEGTEGERWTLPLSTLCREDHQYALSFPAIDQLIRSKDEISAGFP